MGLPSSAPKDRVEPEWFDGSMPTPETEDLLIDWDRRRGPGDHDEAPQERNKRQTTFSEGTLEPVCSTPQMLFLQVGTYMT